MRFTKKSFIITSFLSVVFVFFSSFKEDYFEVIGWENTKQDSTLNLYSRQVYILLIKKEGDCIVLMQKFKD